MTERTGSEDEHFGLSPEGYALAATLAALPPDQRVAELERATGPRLEPDVIVELFLRAHQAAQEGRDFIFEL